MVTIRSVAAFILAPEDIDLVVVKVETSEPGLYGLGCATFTQRASAVAEIVKTYLGPLVVGRDASRIEDLWTLMMGSGYWRGGPATNCAVGGIDMALWDIKGKSAGMPLYQLFGGACRDQVSFYRHADGPSIEAVLEKVRELISRGHRHVRCQLKGYGGAGPMSKSANAESSEVVGGVNSESADDRVIVDPDAYTRGVLELLTEVRREVGDEIHLLHDVHERLPLAYVNQFARDLEQIRLFFLEDPLPPEQSSWLRNLRAATITPIALGELFTAPEQWIPLVQHRLIDYIRVHISMIGGITPARKLATLCEGFGIRTAFHGPGDLTLIGHAVNLHLALSEPNFGIQEMYEPSQPAYDLFPGFPDVVGGSGRPPDSPGIGVDFVEDLVDKYPPKLAPPRWTRTRFPDGTAIFP